MKTFHSHFIFIFLISCLIAIFVSSCDDFVKVDLPDSQLTTPAVFEDKATATAAITAIYSKIRDNSILSGAPNGLSHALALYTDELDYYGATTFPTALYGNSLSSNDTELRNLWTVTYNQIYAVNSILQGLENSSAIALTDRNVLKGEAYFIRALLHFYLTNLYGPIPYISTTDYTINSKVPKLSVDSVYALAKADLDEALKLLPQAYSTPQRTRPNVYTAHALLARVNLYMGLWAEAANEASAVLNQTDLYTMVGIDQTFKSNSSGTLWQLSTTSTSTNTEEGSTFIFQSGPPPRSALTTSFLLSFETNDERKNQWIRAVSNGTSTWYHPYKYQNKMNEGNADEQSILLRLEEQYLIRAEARVRQGDFIGAKEDLNVIRNRAGLANTAAVTEPDILTAIMKERQHELFTELGHRFFDLKRNGLTAALASTKPGWDANDVLFPIPESEILLNPNLKPQNPGY